MIVTKQKDVKEIIEQLEGVERVFLVGCGDCAATCHTGGSEDLEKMARLLTGQGKEVVGMAVPDVACVAAQVKAMIAKNRRAISSAEAVLVFACGSGVQCVQGNSRELIRAMPGCDSLFAAVVDGAGGFHKVCSTCGDCMLTITEGICPVSRCPKGLLNGPCGGQSQGKCEVSGDRDCAWVLIYKRLRDQDKLKKMQRRMSPKDHRKGARAS